MFHKLLLSIVLLLSALVYCQAQLVQTPLDIHRLCQNESAFVGKELHSILKELGPPIQMVFAEGGWAESAPRFMFFFMPKASFDSCRKQGQLPLRLTVYVDRFFEWTIESRSRKDNLTWTKMDEERYGNLLVTAIRVAGVCQLCSAPQIVKR